MHPRRKPAPEIYEAALRRAGLEKGAAWVHAGDDLLNDCAAAKRCGAKTVWVDAAPPSYSENAYSTMTAADREKREAAFAAVDVESSVDARILKVEHLADAVDAALASEPCW